MPTTKEIFEKIGNVLKEDPSRTGGLEAIYQFNLTGDDAAVYQIILGGGQAEVQEGEKEAPNCTLHLAAEDFKQMVEGNLNGTAAFMSGRLKVEGDLGLAMRLESVLSAYSA
ncbi:SCP2 sterol-binding domain-containing protein [Alicyclobacillus mengziensis]|uniref:SCP2 sterol-binding domain-containing protein n=1 Tax=Alicyclobacillus mengziensis TaxID=2931921 RepID=A0A9X7Z555_9BACL|nr:SCP2 sterol-binding domain-containing protein [Alicyclobacillus mengziensis]QSO46007.1 SCP2 sterol-binding domain-containing protein [Alicyclobacillus mengziensis]